MLSIRCDMIVLRWRANGHVLLSDNLRGFVECLGLDNFDDTYEDANTRLWLCTLDCFAWYIQVYT
jgi:hypothetical protein